MMGIYEIRNSLNGKVYVGSSNDIEGRWRTHKWALKNNRHHSKHLQRAYVKYGLDIFNFEVVETVNDESELLIREQFYLDKRNSFDKTKGYNTCKEAGRNCLTGENHPRYGKKLTMEQRELMSSSLKKWFSENEHPGKGKKRNDEVRKKMSLAKKGKVIGEKNNFFGKKHSVESRKKWLNQEKGPE